MAQHETDILPDPRIAQRGCGRANPELTSESHAELDVEPARGGRNSGMESKKGRRWEELRNCQGKRPEGSTRRSQLVREEETQRLSRQCYTVAKPSEAAKIVGMPNSLIVT